MAVGGGAALGAWGRWGLGLWLNHRFSVFPLGTWVANALGGLLIGIALGLLAQKTQLDPLWRLLIVTGFLGGFTTFSTFSAEVVSHLQHGKFGLAMLTAAAHLGASVLLTALGLSLTAPAKL